MSKKQKPLMVKVQLYLPPTMKEALERQIEREYYSDLSELFRAMARNYIKEKEVEQHGRHCTNPELDRGSGSAD
ncbi:CopG family ribbon-helix-helix protein [Thermoactinomyces sp. CICC 23799]|mgnify:CR=1 FL=1|uniref:CopG family ribbon-helix-helix protein n=1 Tax=Thermoactinomyces sp. CICC 23799 TaxID=2767429 RepID=UPI0018DCA349|nr:ribbon-helix-helix domain-containing protein [Thermoactinomyces sp. CICC 23799]MBH8601376.1 ribbon-helix-helix protein, CopG family [Thermoactinomyces sp. CICC 23799]